MDRIEQGITRVGRFPFGGAAVTGIALTAGAIVACSGSSTTIGATRCGAGTELVDNTCVASSDGSAPGALDAAPSRQVDAWTGTTDDASDQDAPAQDAAKGAGDASIDGPSDADAAEPPSDPCPIPGPSSGVDDDCDVKCDAKPQAQQACKAAACSGGGVLTTTPLSPQATSWIIRTPEAPGRDPACASACPSHPWAYELAFALQPVYPIDGYTVSIAPPWYVVSSATSRFCPAASPAAAACIAFQDGSVEHDIYFVTDDPNAPARNAVLRSIEAGGCP